jgi:hypothetical protein
MQFDDASDPLTSLVVETIDGGFPAVFVVLDAQKVSDHPTREPCHPGFLPPYPEHRACDLPTMSQWTRPSDFRKPVICCSGGHAVDAFW